MDSKNSILSDDLERISLCTHVTALKIFRHFLLVAESNELHIYDWKTKKLLKKLNIFENCSIHGIRISGDSKCFLFGAKSINILCFSFETEKWHVKSSQKINLNDWILDAQWIQKQGQDSDSIAAVTAHNCLTLISSRGVNTFQGAENCILYSAAIISSESDAIVLAVGTVFQKILIWSPRGKLNEENRNLPFHELSGHQGVIFSITYSNLHQILCSTSDDRSIRIWKVHCDSQKNGDSILDFWKNSTINILYVLYAHESRVWRATVLENCVLSIGEDSLICVWNLNGELLRKIKGHKSGSIWCIETTHLPSLKGKSKNKDKHLIAFTGGSDGGVYIWNISKAIETDSISQVSLPVKEELFSKDFPRICSLFTERSCKHFLVSTDKGRISLFDMKLNTWNDIFYDSSFSSYCVTSVSKENEILAVGNITGDIVLMNLKDPFSNHKKFHIHNSKIFSIHWVDKTSNYLLSCETEGKMTLCKILLESEWKINRVHRFYLPKCKNHWWTSAVLYLNSNNILVVGDRGGSISIYHHAVDIDDPCTSDVPIGSYKNIHGDNGVTDIQEHASFVYSAGRDGKINQFFVDNGNLKLLHSIKVSHDLEWIGKILFHGPHFLLLGFHTKDFVVWSTQLESAIMTVDCGGGHRSWDFSLSDEGIATFVAIKKKDMIYYQQDLHHMLKESVLKEGISGLKFSCLTFLFTKSFRDKESISFLACGGEDNAVRIIGLYDEKNEDSKLIPVASLSGHLSNVRAINQTKLIEKDAWLLASVGGRSQMILWKLHYAIVGIKCELLVSELLSVSKCKVKKKEDNCIKVDPQTRLMDVSVFPSFHTKDNEEVLLVGVACSDSYFRLYRFEVNKKVLTLCHTFMHDENCILKLKSIHFEATYGKTLFITAATNGSMKILKHEDIFNYPNQSILSEVHIEDFEHCHKSGINALDYKLILELKFGVIYMICSGGDDNCLTVSFLNIKAAGAKCDIESFGKYNRWDAHASQITGVKILDQFTIVSASIDQRINVWNINYKQCPAIMVLHLSIVSLIPDIANLQSWLNINTNVWTLAVCGQGIEFFVFKKQIKSNIEDITSHFTNNFNT